MRKLSLLALVLGLAACRGDDGGGDDTPGMDADPGKTEYTIQEIQDDAMPACDVADPTTCVSLTIKGVVVTAIDAYGDKTGDIWVEEPGGGAYSGVHVYGAPLDQVATLSIGDVVDITGAVKDEFHYNGSGGSGGFPEGYSITELKPPGGGMMTVTATGQTMAITPDVVDALAIGQMSNMAARDAEWEKWEGVLIKLENVQAFSDDDCVGSACNDDTLHSFSVTGDVLVESALAEMPDPAIKYGDCLTGVTGVLDYFFDYQILPRTTDEMGLGGTSCPTESMAAQCGDNIDNDGNGFKDCDDKQCVVGSATCRMNEDAAISGIQGGTVTGNVVVQDAIVTAVGTNKKDVWLSTSGAAAVNEGLQIHFNQEVPNTVVAGKTVNVIGKVVEFNDSMGTGTVTQLTGYDITVQGTGTTAVDAVTGTASTLNNDTTGEPYESVLVTLTNVTLTTLGTTANHHVGELTQGSTPFKFDDAIFQIPEPGSSSPMPHPVNTCFSSVTGIWSYNVYDNFWVFYPVADGTLCP